MLLQVKQAVAREAAKGVMKWETEVLEALHLTREQVTPLSEVEAQQLFARRVAELDAKAVKIEQDNVSSQLVVGTSDKGHCSLSECSWRVWH